MVTRTAILAAGFMIALTASCATNLLTTRTSAASKPARHAAIYDFKMTSITGESVPLSSYRGKVLLIVNTASLCGNTPQYASLETLYQKYKDQGLRILAFPANNFGHQEPGDNPQIQQFCTGKYHTTFDLFSKISVAGADQAPLYSYLTSKSTDPKYAGPIEWNFAKFLIARNGQIVNRFQAGHDPLSQDVVTAVEAELAKPA